jgi:hypothetical protein
MRAASVCDLTFLIIILLHMLSLEMCKRIGVVEWSI